jgi:putative oxidoreductase
MWLLYPGFPGGRIALGLLAVRLAAGAAFIVHGWQKIQNPFGWMGAEATVPGYLQLAAALAELGGGIGWILGALTPLFSVLLGATMSYAVFMVHVPAGDSFVHVNPPGAPYVPSYELALAYLSVAVLLLLSGPGKLSVDYTLFGRGRK